MRNSAEAIAIADRIRQHRFTSQLPHGGQVLALRWILEAEDRSLSPEGKLRRQELLNRYPQYQAISTQAREQRDRLRAIQPADADAAAVIRQAEEANKLQDLGNEQERLLRELAFRGEHAPLEFPPRLNLPALQNELPEKTLVLSFITTPRSFYAMMFTKDQSKFAVWSIANPRKLPGSVATLLRAMNIRDGKTHFTWTELQDQQWKEPAKKLLAELIDPQQVGFWNNFEELVIVPEGPLWHLPFEVLQIPDGDATVALGSRVRIRYAPTISMAVPGLMQRERQPTTVVEAGRLIRGETRTFSDEEMEDWKRFVPQLTLLPDKLPGSVSVLKTRWDRLVVFDEIPEVREPFAFTPLPRAGSRPENQLLGWMSSPWGGPYTVILPGVVTSAASGLKQAQDGPELATVTLGLMAAGTRSVLISRWPSGGQTSYDLVREYVREIDHGSSAKAWQRAVVLTRELEIDPSREPRVRTSPEDAEQIKAEHPFFWAGYMLVDTGFEAGQN
jgi:CHAT domain-containing protein